MSKLKKLQDRGVALSKKLRELDDKSAAEDDRAFTEDEQKEFDALSKEADTVAAAIKREEGLLAMERALIPTGSAATSTPAGTTATLVTVEEGATLTPGEPVKPKPWGSLGEQLVAVAHAQGNPVSLWDERLRPQQEQAAITGLGETIPSDGGFLVQQDFVSTLLERTYASNQILSGGAGYSGVQMIPISGNSNGVKINGIDETSRADGSRWGGVQVFWEAEAGTKVATKPTFRQIELSLKKLIGLCYATDELLADAAALDAVISKAFAREFAFKIQDALISGTGAGMLLGILNSGVLVTQAKELGQVADTIVKDNIDLMWSRMWPTGITNSVWLINQTCYPQLFKMTLDVGTGGMPVYLPPGGLSASPYGTLMGRPVVPIEQCEAVGTKGDILFCDWAEYLFADKGGLQAASSIHVRFINDETAFRFVFRADGQPAWASPTTPFKGGSTATTGPFIALASRD
jgi:HK97 family phage major capsid protein